MLVSEVTSVDVMFTFSSVLVRVVSERGMSLCCFIWWPVILESVPCVLLYDRENVECGVAYGLGVGLLCEVCACTIDWGKFSVSYNGNGFLVRKCFSFLALGLSRTLEARLGIYDVS